MSTVQKTAKIPPKEYNQFLQSLDLRDIHLRKLKCNRTNHVMTEKGKFEFNEASKLLSHEGQFVTIEIDYTLKAKCGRKLIAQINATYTLVFSTSKKIPAEFFDIYKQYSLPLQTFPYFRELTNTLFSRMGIPPLLLPLRKNLVGSGQ